MPGISAPFWYRKVVWLTDYVDLAELAKFSFRNHYWKAFEELY